MASQMFENKESEEVRGGGEPTEDDDRRCGVRTGQNWSSPPRPSCNIQHILLLASGNEEAPQQPGASSRATGYLLYVELRQRECGLRPQSTLHSGSKA